MKKMRLGLAGLGFGRHIIDTQILSGPAAPFFELAAVCDADQKRLDRAVADYAPRGVRGFASLEEMLRDDGIEVVALYSGPNGRADLLRQIIRSGRDVMTTKPFELDPQAAQSILDEAASLGRVIHLNSPCATRPEDFKVIDEWRQKYDLGRPVAARHQVWYRNLEKADGTWYDDPARCPAGPMFRIGIYGINDLVQLLGEPEAVQVMSTRILTGRPTPDFAQMTIRFRNGALAQTTAGLCLDGVTGGNMSLAVYYERGAIFRNPSFLRNEGEGESALLALILGTQNCNEPVAAETRQVQSYSNIYQWDMFYRAIHGEAIPEPTPASAIVDGVRVLDAMARAAASGNTEPVLQVTLEKDGQRAE